MSATTSGLSLARERGWSLVWDRQGWLYLLDHAGSIQSQRHFPALRIACAADDASAYAASDAHGRLWWLAPDLMARWENVHSAPVVALALDSFGQYLAAADAQGGVVMFTCTGQTIAAVQSPRPIYHLAFVPAVPWFIAGSDYGLLAAYGVDGHCRWRQSLITQVGGLATSGAGDVIALACFTHGVCRFDGEGRQLAPIPTPAPCHGTALSYGGDVLAAACLDDQVRLLNSAGETLAAAPMDEPITAVALEPLGNGVLYSGKHGIVSKLEVVAGVT